MSLFQIVSKKNKISNMKVIKILTYIFTALSMIAVASLLVYFMVKSSVDVWNNYEFIIMGFFALMVLNIAIGGLTLIRLRVDSKSILWGIVAFLFVSPIAGALYLVWKPTPKEE